MYKFRIWCINNREEINSFIIVLLVVAGIIDLTNEQYLVSAITFGIAYVNYIFRKSL